MSRLKVTTVLMMTLCTQNCKLVFGSRKENEATFSDENLLCIFNSNSVPIFLLAVGQISNFSRNLTRHRL